MRMFSEAQAIRRLTTPRPTSTTTPITARRTSRTTTPSTSTFSPTARRGPESIWPTAVARAASERKRSARQEMAIINLSPRASSSIDRGPIVEARGLQAVYRRVAATGRHQLFVGPAFDHQPVFEHHDAVGP